MKKDKAIDLIIIVLMLPIMSVGILVFSVFAFFIIGDVVVMQLALCFSFVYMVGELFIVYFFKNKILDLREIKII